MKKMMIAMMILCIAGCAFALSQVVPYVAESVASERAFNELSEQIGSDGETKAESAAVESFKEVQAQNPDMVAWLKIEGTSIDYPVMHTPEDETYYLYRDFNGDKSKEGTPFLAADCTLDTNLIIYGHNMKTGKMFGALMDYKKASHWQEHPQITLLTDQGFKTYNIFAVVRTNINGARFICEMIDNGTEAEFEENLERIKSLSLYETGLKPNHNDQLITLSTCEYSRPNGRLLVMGYGTIRNR